MAGMDDERQKVRAHLDEAIAEFNERFGDQAHAMLTKSEPSAFTVKVHVHGKSDVLERFEVGDLPDKGAVGIVLQKLRSHMV
jgi:hypothetical protein